MKKSYFALMVLTFTLLTFASCDEEEEDHFDNSLVGTYELQKEEYSIAGGDMETRLYTSNEHIVVFRNDATYETTRNGSLWEKGTYSVKGEKLYIYEENGDDITFDILERDEIKLTIKGQEKNENQIKDFTLYFEKK